MPSQVPTTGPFWQSVFHDPVATFTLLLVVATTGLWLFTALLWRATVNLAKDAKETAENQGDKMERAIAESARSSAAMERQNEIAEQTAKRQLRAYLAVIQANMPEVTLGSEPIVIRLEVENTGATPANYYFTQVAWKVTDLNPTTELFDNILSEYAPDPPDDAELVHSFGSRQKKSMPFPTPVGDEWRSKILSGEMKLYFLGKIRYQDIFGELHVTKFFYVYTTNLPNHMGQVHVCNHIG